MKDGSFVYVPESNEGPATSPTDLGRQ